MTFRQVTKDKVVVLIGGGFVAILLLSAWFPQPCPLLSRNLSVCKNPFKPMPPLTAEQRDRIDHPSQPVTTPYAFFSVNAQEKREQTLIRFFYKGDLSQESAYLQVKGPEGFRDISLVTDPLVASLDWPVIVSEDYQLFQKNSQFDSLASFLSHLPSPEIVAADKVAAKQFHLNSNQYTPLEDASKSTSIQFILTSYARPRLDGSWKVFEKTFNLQDNVIINTEHKLEFALSLPHQPLPNHPFLLGTVHVDYKQSHP